MKVSLLLNAVISGFVLVGNSMVVHAQTGQNDSKWNVNLPAGLLTDSSTDLQFRKIGGISGKKDIIQYTTGLHISPNGKFLLHNSHIIPIDGGEAIRFVDMPAYRSTWSPNGKMIAYYSGGIWVIPVSQEVGRPTGPARKIIDGDYWYETSVQWSPDSEKIVFHSDDQHLHIFSLKDGSQTKIVQDGVFRVVQGGWSPDGRHIACRRPNEGIWIVPVDGGETRKLIDTKSRVRPYWSPDGKWISFQGDGRLQFVRVSDAATFDIPLPEEAGVYISPSSNGRLLFYRSSYEWTDTLKIISAGGGKPVDPTRGRMFSAVAHKWSPDGKFILTWAQDEDKWVNWIVPITGGTPHPLRLDVSIPGELEQGFLSPDSKKLVFSSKSPDGQMRYWVSPVSLTTGKASGLVTEVFDKGEVQDISHRWSQDGSKLLFLFEKDLWMSRTDGSGAVQLTGVGDRQVVRRRYSFSPDGSAVAWISYSTSTGISVLRMRRLSEDKARDIAETSKRLAHQWSPDGSRIAYEFHGSEEDATRELFVASVPDGESKKLIEVRPEYHASFDYRWAPGGERLALVVGRKVMLFHFPGGESQQIGNLIDPVLGRCFGMAWSPDGQVLALSMEQKPSASHREEFGTRIFTVTVPEGRWIELEGEPDYNYTVSWSPDGKWISYDSEEYIKVRPEGILWELDVDAFLNRAKEEPDTGSL